ncbi:hypothetical protein [Oceanibium sediminis]|uniref:hypothetical protein n=1 Tax=Oceanibium sediminis TaxID=2026339 RepID=UPI000DD4C4FB|nr:hypothetical protein [Oceanibium sediminis]
MTQVVTLFLGIIVAALIFAATLFSAVQAFRQAGRLRLAHLLAAGLTIAIMACLSSELWVLARLTGGLCVLAGLFAFVLESRWNRLLPLVQSGFGLVVALGLPFGG